MYIIHIIYIYTSQSRYYHVESRGIRELVSEEKHSKVVRAWQWRIVGRYALFYLAVSEARLFGIITFVIPIACVHKSCRVLNSPSLQQSCRISYIIRSTQIYLYTRYNVIGVSYRHAYRLNRYNIYKCVFQFSNFFFLLLPTDICPTICQKLPG